MKELESLDRQCASLQRQIKDMNASDPDYIETLYELRELTRERVQAMKGGAE